MKIPAAPPPATPGRPTSATGQAGPRAEFQQLIHELENGMWGGARAGEGRMEKPVAGQPFRESSASRMATLQTQPVSASTRSIAQTRAETIAVPVRDTTSTQLAARATAGDTGRQRQGTALEHGANTLALFAGGNAATLHTIDTMAATRVGAATDRLAPALLPAYQPLPDGLLTVMQGPNGLSISVRFKESNLKESDALRMSDIHRHILQTIKDRGMALERLFINGNEASSAILKELNHGN